MEIEIQEHVDSEQDVLRKFLYLAIYTPPGQSPPPMQVVKTPELSRYVDGWGEPDDHAVFAILEGKIIGACWARRFSEVEPGYGFIRSDIPELSIAVFPEHRQKGVGTKLLQALIDKLQTKYRAVSLSVSTENPARHLYEKLGFTRFHQTSHHLVMIKALHVHV